MEYAIYIIFMLKLVFPISFGLVANNVININYQYYLTAVRKWKVQDLLKTSTLSARVCRRILGS